jgi:FtsH-binding integral membrane protein
MHGTYMGRPIEELGVEARSVFITRVYIHLLAALIGFTVLEMLYFETGLAGSIASFVAGTSWLFVLGAFMVVGWLASRTAHTATSLAAQYAALGAFVVAESLIFVPMLYVANQMAAGVIQSAATVTLVGAAGLTAVALITRRDFSFLRGILMWGGIVALVAIVASVLFGFAMGTWFSVAMIGFAGAAVLYDTSNVLHHYSEDRYVAASLELFASIALMFWYVLRLFMSRDD